MDLLCFIPSDYDVSYQSHAIERNLLLLVEALLLVVCFTSLIGLLVNYLHKHCISKQWHCMRALLKHHLIDWNISNVCGLISVDGCAQYMATSLLMPWTLNLKECLRIRIHACKEEPRVPSFLNFPFTICSCVRIK